METEDPHAGEYAAVMQKMLAENEQAAEAVRTAGRQELSAALVEREAARAYRQEIESGRERYLAEYTEQHRQELLSQMRSAMRETLAQELLEADEDDVEGLLDLPERLADDIRLRVGYRKLGTQYARLQFESSGRGGYLNFRRGPSHCRFWYEIGAGDVLMVIEIPKEADWEHETGIPLAERPAVLQLIAEETILRQAPDSLFRIDANSIVIYD